MPLVIAKMTSLFQKIINKERDFRSREFLAPYNSHLTKAVIKMDGMHYRFHIDGHKGSGIGIFMPVDATHALYKEEASWELSQKYMKVLPFIHMILAYETEDGWVAYPMHSETARIKLGVGLSVVYNVSDAERFDVVTAKFDGINFWHDDIFTGADLTKSQLMREAFNMKWLPSKMRTKFKKIKGTTPEDKETFELAIDSWLHFKKVSTEEQLQEVLKPGGGKFQSYIVRGKNLEVKWTSKSGRLYISTVRKESFDGICAGFCVDGEDTKFHLKDYPFIAAIGEADNAIYETTYRNIDYEGEWDD